MSLLKNIIFDLGGVLLDLDVPGCMNSLEKIGLNEVRRWMTGTNEKGFFNRYESGLLTTVQFREAIRQWTGRNLLDEDIDKAWNSMLRDIPEEKLDLLLSLKKNYKLFLLSNTNELHWQVCAAKFVYKGMEVQDYFSHVFLSFQMHLVKPDKEIFRLVLEEGGLLAEETLFIDDSVENCQAAVSVGMNAVHYIPGDNLNMQLQKYISKWK